MLKYTVSSSSPFPRLTPVLSRSLTLSSPPLHPNLPHPISPTHSCTPISLILFPSPDSPLEDPSHPPNPPRLTLIHLRVLGEPCSAQPLAGLLRLELCGHGQMFIIQLEYGIIYVYITMSISCISIIFKNIYGPIYMYFFLKELDKRQRLVCSSFPRAARSSYSRVLCVIKSRLKR